MSLRTNNPPLLPKLNQKRALFVLSKIDAILAWEQRAEGERDTRFVDLGRYLCEVRAGQYWRVESMKSFDEFLERRFPDSRRKAYYLMSIHEYLPPQIRRELKQVGWTKAAELTKVARSDGQDFDCATWLHKARELPKEHFKHEVEKQPHRQGYRTNRNYLFQVIQKPDPSDRTSGRNRCTDARFRQIPWLLPGNDLRGLSGGSQ